MKSEDIERSSHVMPTWVCAMAGIYGCGIQDSAHLNMKTRHCISGCSRVVPSGLGLTHCHRLRPADGGGCCLLGYYGTPRAEGNEIKLFRGWLWFYKNRCPFNIICINLN